MLFFFIIIEFFTFFVYHFLTFRAAGWSLWPLVFFINIIRGLSCPFCRRPPFTCFYLLPQPVNKQPLFPCWVWAHILLIKFFRPVSSFFQGLMFL